MNIIYIYKKKKREKKIFNCIIFILSCDEETHIWYFLSNLQLFQQPTLPNDTLWLRINLTISVAIIRNDRHNEYKSAADSLNHRSLPILSIIYNTLHFIHLYLYVYVYTYVYIYICIVCIYLYILCVFSCATVSYIFLVKCVCA